VTDYSVTYMASNQREIWDTFVESSDNGTVFHRTDFLAYHGDVAGRCDLMVWKGASLQAVMPLRVEQKERETIGYTPWGGSFGGLVTISDKAAFLEPVCEAIYDFLREEGVDRLILSCSPAPYSRSGGVAQEYFMLRSVAEYELSSARVTSVIDLSRPLQLSQNMKRNLSYAKKQGVVVKESGDPEVVYRLLQKTLEEKHGSSVTHSVEEFCYLSKNLREQFRMFLAEVEGVPQATVVLLENSSPCSMAFYNGYDHDVCIKGALPLVFHEVTEYCARAGKSFLDLGATSMTSKPINEGLFRFKEGWGSHLVYRNTYAITL